MFRPLLNMHNLLTSQIHLTLGTRGNFGFVLPVKVLATSGVVARCQGRPQRR